MHKENSVLIVGAGPTGLSAALTLTKRGFTPRIIDERLDPITTSNALVVQPKTMEIWEELGVIQDALVHGYKLSGAEVATSDRSIFTIHYGDLPTKYPFLLVLPQARTEQILLQHLAGLGIAVERGVQLESLSEVGNQIAAVCNGQKRVYQWVLGCDGAKSMTRQLAGIAFSGEEYPKHFIMADLSMEWEKSSAYLHITLSDAGVFAFFPFDDKGRGRIVFDVSEDARLQQEKNPVLEDFQKLLSARRSSAILHSPEWISSFWVHSRIADSYRKGHLFLLGDAAHQHSPFGGQGMNIGVHDAYFLGSLLADVQEGKRAIEALDLYEKKRKKVGKQVVFFSTAMMRIATLRSPWAKRWRNAVLRIVASFPWFRRRAALLLSQLGTHGP